MFRECGVACEKCGFVFNCSGLPLPISGLSSIQLCVLQESRDLVTFLIPELSKLAEAMKLKVSACMCVFHCSMQGCYHCSSLYPFDFLMCGICSCLLGSFAHRESIHLWHWDGGRYQVSW